MITNSASGFGVDGPLTCVIRVLSTGGASCGRVGCRGPRRPLSSKLEGCGGRDAPSSDSGGGQALSAGTLLWAWQVLLLLLQVKVLWTRPQVRPGRALAQLQRHLQGARVPAGAATLLARAPRPRKRGRFRVPPTLGPDLPQAPAEPHP